MPGSDHFQLAGSAAEFYDKLPARYLLGPWSRGLVDAAAIRAHERILDLACGTGVVTREVAARLGPGGSVTGLDLNEGMLEVARAYENPGSGELRWVKASALDTGLPDRTFDVVLCQQGFQFFPDQPRALVETRRVLREDGRLRFSIWAESGPYNRAVAAAVRHHIDDETAVRYLQSREVPSPRQLESMFTAAGFRDVTVTRVEMRNRLPNIAGFVSEHLLGVPIADRVSRLSEEEHRALGAAVATAMSEFADGDDVVVPDFINLVSARK